MTDDRDDERGVLGNPVVLLAVVGVALVGVVGVTLADVGQPSGEEILNETQDRYASADTVVGSATVTVANETTTRSYDAEYTVAENNRTRVSVTGDNGTVVAGSNGTVAWVHDEATGVTRVFDPNETSEYDASELNETQNETLRDAADRLQTLAADWDANNTTATREGTEPVDGTDAWIVEVRSTNESRDGVVTYWVAKESDELLKQRYAGENATVTIRYTDTRFDVSVANSTFQPPGVAATSVQTVETFDALQAATETTVPQLDDDYRFATGRVLATGGETTVAEYAGPTNATVVTTTADRAAFEDANATEIEIGDRTANVTERDGRVVVAWQEDGVTVAVVTDDRETAIALAESLVGETDAPERLSTPDVTSTAPPA